jgi:hypothetical protein
VFSCIKVYRKNTAASICFGQNTSLVVDRSGEGLTLAVTVDGNNLTLSNAPSGGESFNGTYTKQEGTGNNPGPGGDNSSGTLELKFFKDDATEDAITAITVPPGYQVNTLRVLKIAYKDSNGDWTYLSSGSVKWYKNDEEITGIQTMYQNRVCLYANDSLLDTAMLSKDDARAMGYVKVENGDGIKATVVKS